MCNTLLVTCCVAFLLLNVIDPPLPESRGKNTSLGAVEPRLLLLSVTQRDSLGSDFSVPSGWFFFFSLLLLFQGSLFGSSGEVWKSFVVVQFKRISSFCLRSSVNSCIEWQWCWHPVHWVEIKVNSFFDLRSSGFVNPWGAGGFLQRQTSARDAESVHPCF